MIFFSNGEGDRLRAVALPYTSYIYAERWTVVDEQWVEIPQYEDYIVSNLGRIKSVRTDTLLKQSSNGTNLIITLRDGGRTKVTRMVKTLVAEAYLDDPPKPSGYTLMHVDGDRENCRADNLRWISLRDLRWRAWMESQGFDPDSKPIKIFEKDLTFNNIFECALYVDGEASQIHRATRRIGAVYKGYTYGYIL